MKTHIRISVVLAGLVSLALLTACAGADTGSGEDCEVRTLLVGTFTGNASEHGLGAKAGSESAVRTINAAGGINGCTLVLDIVDDGGDYTQTLPLAQAALAKNEYAHVNVTGYGGSSVQPYLIAEDQFAITNLGNSGIYADTSLAKFQFDTITLIADSDVITVGKAIEDGATKIGLVTDNAVTGQNVVDGVIPAAEAAGAEVVATELIDFSAVDMTPVVQRLKAAGADTVFFDLYGVQVAYLIRDIKASGWDVPIYGGQVAYVTDLEPLLPEEDYAGIIMGGSAGLTAPSNDAAQAVIDDVIANGDDNIKAHLAGVLWASDSLTLFGWAANSVGSTDAAEMSAFLEENGSADAPGISMAAQTGYSSKSHDWKGADAIALVEATARDEVGRYPERLGLFTPPAN